MPEGTEEELAMRVMPAWRRAMGMGDWKEEPGGDNLLMGSGCVKSLSPGDPARPGCPEGLLLPSDN